MGDRPDTDGPARSSEPSAPLPPSPTTPLSNKAAANEAYTRYKETWDLAHMDKAILLYQRAIDAAPEPDAYLLGELGHCLNIQYQNQGKLEDLERGIVAEQGALRLIPDEHPDKALRLNNLSFSLLRRYERLDELDALKSAMTMQQRSVELTPADHPADISRHLDNLGYLQCLRYERFGELADLERSIANRQRAVDLAPDAHPGKPIRLNNLGLSLRRRFERLGEPDDLERAITAQRRAVELTPDGHPDMPPRLGNLGSLHWLRYERFGDLEDLECAIEGQRRAVDITPDGHPNKPIYLNNLGLSRSARFERLGEPDDLERAITAQRRAVELTPEGHPDMSIWLDNLGGSQWLRYKRFRYLEDLERAIAGQRRAVDLTSDGHPEKRIRRHNLGLSLAAYFRREKSEETFNETLSCFLSSVAQLHGSPSLRLDTAKFTVQFLHENPQFSTPETLILAYSCIVDIIPELAWLGHSFSRRIEESSKLGSLVNAAVRVAISLGAYAHAIEWLEAGRALIWSQALSLRDPLDDLAEKHPDLASAFKHVLIQLQRSTHTSAPPSSSLDGMGSEYASSTQTQADHHRGLAIAYGKLLSEVRCQPGFESFMRPKEFSALLPSCMPYDGSIVFINVDKARCDALILSREKETKAVALPELSIQRAKELRSQWLLYLRLHNTRERGSMVKPPVNTHQRSPVILAEHILGRIWRWIVNPILQALGLSGRVRDLWRWVLRPALQALGFSEGHSGCERLPHITWCPTGPLTQLPLHAAGVYVEETGPRIYDFVVSSYTLSLSALTRSINGLITQSAEPSVLVITQPDTPKLPTLPGAIIEAKHMSTVLGSSQIAYSVFSREKATTDTVKGALGEHPWLHLACHGHQDLNDPLQSAFALHDGPLTLSDLMNTTSDNAELAFLSACQTAVGDEKIPEESMHLAAGMLAVGYKGVIATMWSIKDHDAPVVVEAYYRKLLELRASGTLGKGETGAAYALHEATKQLRENIGEKEVARWAPFVHFGI